MRALKIEQCNGKTKLGRRCKNRPYYDGLCWLHRRQKFGKSSAAARFERIDRTISLVGGSIAIIEAIAKVSEYIVHHWESIVGMAPRWFKPGNLMSYHPPFSGLSRSASRLNEFETKLTIFNFDEWFDTFPKEMQESVNKEFGSDWITSLRKGTLLLQRNLT